MSFQLRVELPENASYACRNYSIHMHGDTLGILGSCGSPSEGGWVEGM